jgi:hypothetical protein
MAETAGQRVGLSFNPDDEPRRNESHCRQAKALLSLAIAVRQLAQ